MNEPITKEESDAAPKFSEYEAEWSKRGYEPHIATLLAKADWSADMISWQEDEIERLRDRVQELENQRDVTHDELVHRSNSR